MILVDLHVHPTPWTHGLGSYQSFVRSAISRGINILGFTEHGPPIDPHSRYRGLTNGEIETYVGEIQKVKGEFKGYIQIFCGLELDYHPRMLERYRKLAEDYPFDYFLGSVHIIDDWHLDTPDTLKSSVHRHKSIEELYRLYFDQISAGAGSGLFDCLAHLDYVRRSLPHPPGEPPDFSQDIYEDIAQQIAARDVAVEINTRGLSREDIRETYPTRPLLKYLVRAKVRLTMGSDAHEDDRVGEGLKEARRSLREESQTVLTYFKGRRALELDILT